MLSISELLRGSVHGQQVATDLLTEGLKNVELLKGEGFSDKEARWALVLVDSRAFTFRTPEEWPGVVKMCCRA